MMASWEVHVAPEDRPDEPQHDYDVDNMFAVTLRDAGEVAIIDGASKKVLNYVETGYAVHISRASSSGRYFTTIGRDGQIDLIDCICHHPKLLLK
ncbi:cytochrome D1 domain-containing protein [Pseudidiomarina halophila]|uniref:cytochrome D1 domain-containing protein n=1 Tax=Pseudidiomarina halophila TaxID=1449799 RepID=UPI0036212CC9